VLLLRQLWLALAVGPRPQERAQRGGHQGVGGCASGGVPAWFNDGFKGSLPAILGHCGWGAPETPPGQRPGAHAALAAAAVVALRPGRQAVPAYVRGPLQQVKDQSALVRARANGIRNELPHTSFSKHSGTAQDLIKLRRVGIEHTTKLGTGYARILGSKCT
jgi:hypothetical protein